MCVRVSVRVSVRVRFRFRVRVRVSNLTIVTRRVSIHFHLSTAGAKDQLPPPCNHNSVIDP